MSRSPRATRLALIGLALTITLVGVLIASPPPAGEDDDTAAISTTTTTTAGISTTSTTTTSTTITTTTTTTEPPYEGWVDPRSSGCRTAKPSRDCSPSGGTPRARTTARDPYRCSRDPMAVP